MTPEQAATWLENNPNIRKLRAHRVASMARAIESGHFETTHQGIAIADDGALIDGQHRLTAIARTGVTVKLLVTRGLPRSAVKTIDSGMPRQAYERLGTDKLNTSICSSLLSIVGGRTRPQEYEIELCLDIFAPILSECESTIGGWRNKRKVGSAASLAAMSLLISANADSGMLPEMKKMMSQALGGDLYGAPPSVINYYKQMMEGVKTFKSSPGKGAVGQVGNFCRAWVAMNPKNKNNKLLMVRDPKTVLSDAVVAFNDVTDGVFAEQEPIADAKKEDSKKQTYRRQTAMDQAALNA